MEVVLHKGVYKKTATVTQAVFMVTGLTIGAGVFGLPYAIAQVGLVPGLLLIIFLGLIMLGVNLMIGEIAWRAKEELQLPGLAGKYLGKYAKWLLSAVIIISWFGTLLAYLVGEGASLAELLGGSDVIWGVMFWSVASFVLWGGLHDLKRVDRVVSALVIGFLAFLSLALLPHANMFNATLFNPAKIFMPFGVILFALHATPAVAEIHALALSLRDFRRALVIGTLIPIVIYCLFTAAVVLVSGLSTTEIATIGIGEQFGPAAILIGNTIAVLAMLTCYLGLGTALKETFTWDHAIDHRLSTALVLVIPLALYLLGSRSFITILNIVGGVFIGLELIIMTLVYLRMRHKLLWGKSKAK